MIPISFSVQVPSVEPCLAKPNFTKLNRIMFYKLVLLKIILRNETCLLRCNSP